MFNQGSDTTVVLLKINWTVAQDEFEMGDPCKDGSPQ